MKQRNPSIDILKFFAALLITNSHMGMLYPESLIRLSTGGAIGDVLFFFCSGFTLFLGRGGDFFNWYKRRINRIYPTVLMWAAIMAFVFDVRFGMDFTILHGGGWFVSCIMIYYVLLYFIKRYFIDRLKWVFGAACVAVLGWYFTEDSSSIFMYGETYFKWCHYFLFMLAGAVCGLRMKEHGVETHHRGKNLCLLIVSILLFYGLQIAGTKQEAIAHLQVLTLIPLMGVTLGMYRLCCESWLIRLYNLNWMHRFMYSVSALCLEIYLCQGLVFNTSWNHWFPLNIFINLVLIVAMAYVVKVASNWFSQTFKEGDYDWKKMVRL